jgi:caffeoyl-CoA O-methyltransferase
MRRMMLLLLSGAVLIGMASRGAAQGTADAKSAPLEAPPVPKDEDEAKIYQLLEEITAKQGRILNVPPHDGRLLRVLTEAIDAQRVVEIGTSNGISSIWIGLALKKTGGKLITHELDSQRVALARANFQAAGMADRITVVEGDAHAKIAALQGPLDLVFIDAEKPGYLDYLQKLLPLVRPGGLLLVHNMDLTEPAFQKAITTNPELELLVFPGGGNMGVALKKR